MAKQVITFTPDTLREGVEKLADRSTWGSVGANGSENEFLVGDFINLALEDPDNPGKIAPEQMAKLISRLPQSLKNAIEDAFRSFHPGESDLEIFTTYGFELLDDYIESTQGSMIVFANPQSPVFCIIDPQYFLDTGSGTPEIAVWYSPDTQDDQQLGLNIIYSTGENKIEVLLNAEYVFGDSRDPNAELVIDHSYTHPEDFQQITTIFFSENSKPLIGIGGFGCETDPAFDPELCRFMYLPSPNIKASDFIDLEHVGVIQPYSDTEADWGISLYGTEDGGIGVEDYNCSAYELTEAEAREAYPDYPWPSEAKGLAATKKNNIRVK